MKIKCRVTKERWDEIIKTLEQAIEGTYADKMVKIKDAMEIVVEMPDVIFVVIKKEK